MAKNSTLAELSDDDLVAALSESKEELFNLRFQLVTGQLDNYSRIKQVKKDVARAMTELRLREISKAEASAGSSERADIAATDNTEDDAATDDLADEADQMEAHDA
ncbi:MAG: 50S ribosomal protein L29 [Acidimicrobiales bacterium]